ncbi:MAG: radical SAM protein, partial [Candidatus Omnitrophica bacterium]|nr:radical SAM protein [Candidatus Omnitrophota bacterium]
FEETLRTVGYAPFFFSKGCPYLCTYCSNHAIAKRYGSSRNTPRFRSPENCIREIEDVISRFKITTIGIFDDILGIDRKWRDEFLKKYKEKIRIRFFCLLRANLVDEKFVRLLKNAGCYRISMGVESGNDYIRNTVMNRGLSEKQIIKAFDLCRQYRIQTNSLNIIGTPGETEEMIWDTIHLNRRLRATSSGVNIFYPYKGTQLGDHCFSEGLVNEDLYYSFSSERRSSVLNYPDDFKEKLVYYSRNWEDLINKGNISYWLKKFVKGLLVKVQIWDFLIKFKKSIRRFFKK